MVYGTIILLMIDVTLITRSLAIITFDYLHETGLLIALDFL